MRAAFTRAGECDDLSLTDYRVARQARRFYSVRNGSGFRSVVGMHGVGKLASNTFFPQGVRPGVPVNQVGDEHWCSRGRTTVRLDGSRSSWVDKDRGDLPVAYVPPHRNQ
ncbi:hypothetical protein MTP99_016884 [Tenebrio molitor]|nr:hypothetical protein MTP99_016884 [Tenebrio molitor]